MTDIESNNGVNPVYRNPPTVRITDPKDVEIEEQPEARKTRDEEYEHATSRLRQLLRLYLYSPVKLKSGVVSFHLIQCLLFCLQITKIGLITTQMFNFGHDRANFSSVVNRGHLALRHLMLKGWDASWETLPYPPASGEFAVYTIDDLVAGIDFAVSSYYNAEQQAIGYYIRRPEDMLTFHLKYFDFPGFDRSTMANDIIIRDISFPVEHGLHKYNNSGDISYNYSIMEEFEYLNLSQPIKRLLSITLKFDMHSVRVAELKGHARCLRINGEITFKDLDNNGQVNVDMETLTSRISCSAMNLSVPDWILDNSSKTIGAAVITFTLLSLLTTVLSTLFAFFLLWKTKQYMRKYYATFFGKSDKKDLPSGEYFKLFKLWDIIVILADIFTLYGTIWIVFNVETTEWELETIDSYTVFLGIGCVLAWINLLRYFKFNNKFHLLFNTLYGAFGNVMAYLVCVGVLFFGFWVCGYVVMGPYHVKFRTPAAAMETLFSVINGDEIFATLAILEADKSGGDWVFWFSRIYIGAYVAIFTIVVINLLIAIFMSSYEEIKAYYEVKPEEKDLSSMEIAIRRFLQKNSDRNSFRASLYDLMSSSSNRSQEEATLKSELSKIVRVSDSSKDVVLIRQRTFKAFIEDDSNTRRELDCYCFKCSFVMFSVPKGK